MPLLVMLPFSIVRPALKMCSLHLAEKRACRTSALGGPTRCQLDLKTRNVGSGVANLYGPRSSACSPAESESADVHCVCHLSQVGTARSSPVLFPLLARFAGARRM